MQQRRMTALIAVLMLIGFLSITPAVRAAQYPSVSFGLSSSGDGTWNLVLNYCADINYVWFLSEELSPAPKPLSGRTVRTDIRGCDSAIVAKNVLVGDVLKVGVGGGDRYPHWLEGTTYYYIERTDNSLHTVTGEQEPRLPLMITYVRFTLSQNYGGSIVATYCMNAPLHSMSSTEVTSGNTHELGRWEWGEINGCESRYPAIGVGVNETIQVDLSANTDYDPESYDGDFLRFQITRTSEGLDCSIEQPKEGFPFVRTSCDGFYPQP